MLISHVSEDRFVVTSLGYISIKTQNEERIPYLTLGFVLVVPKLTHHSLPFGAPTGLKLFEVGVFNLLSQHEYISYS